MTISEKIMCGVGVVAIALSITNTILIAAGNSSLTANSDQTVGSTVTAASTSEATISTTDTEDDAINLADYVTYFDLVYAAYTNPDKFLNKEITVVGYYSNSSYNTDTAAGSTAEASTAETSGTEDKVYHFITAYGQVDECHISAEFTTANGEYPDTVGTVISITGKFTSYEEDGNTYYTVAADSYSVVGE